MIKRPIENVFLLVRKPKNHFLDIVGRTEARVLYHRDERPDRNFRIVRTASGVNNERTAVLFHRLDFIRTIVCDELNVVTFVFMIIKTQTALLM